VRPGAAVVAREMCDRGELKKKNPFSLLTAKIYLKMN